jgi:apolipoprotein N-acyltransferase
MRMSARMPRSLQPEAAVPLISRTTLFEAGLCTLGGTLYFLSFLSFDLFPLTWICFVPVLWAIRQATLARALLLGLLFGFVTNAGGFYWIIHLITEFGGQPWIVAVLGLALLCLYQGALVALVILLVRAAEIRLRVAPAWSLPIALVAVEFTYPLLFPSYIGNSQFKFTTLTQIVDVTGVLGLSALIGLLNGAIYELTRAAADRRKVVWTRALVAPTLAALALLYGFVRLPQIDATTAAARTLRIGVVQTNIGSTRKGEAPEAFMREHLTMSHQLVSQTPGIDLLLWPESVYDGYLYKNRPQPTLPEFAQLGKPVILGALTIDDVNGDQRAEFFNSVVVMSAEGRMTDTFDKVELLAFGETLPFARVIPAIGQLIGDGRWFTHGSSYTHLRFGDVKLLPTVCYEDIVPAHVRRIWGYDGPAAAIVNVTNDSWYGDTHEPMIHLALASFRSIETRRSLIRSTNTGISAVIDPAGRVVQRTGQWTRETLVADVPLIETGTSTFYVRFGDLIGYLAVLLTAVAILLAWRRPSRDSHPF